VFWSSSKINTDQPRLLDLAPTVLDVFGVDVPGYMHGRPLFGERAPTRKPAPAPKPAKETVAS
jgi:arylsulfatase A-like enzyme